MSRRCILRYATSAAVPLLVLTLTAGQCNGTGNAPPIAEADIEVVGGGADRTLRITPAPQGLGRLTITLQARDPEGLEDNASFALEVTRPFSTQLAKLTASDAEEFDNFGLSVAIDGDHALIGAPGKDDDAGAAYAYLK